MTNPNDQWDGSDALDKALRALATSSRPISASRVKTAAATALDNVKVGLAETGKMSLVVVYQHMSSIIVYYVCVA